MKCVALNSSSLSTELTLGKVECLTRRINQEIDILHSNADLLKRVWTAVVFILPLGCALGLAAGLAPVSTLFCTVVLLGLSQKSKERRFNNLKEEGFRILQSINDKFPQRKFVTTSDYSMELPELNKKQVEQIAPYLEREFLPNDPFLNRAFPGECLGLKAKRTDEVTMEGGTYQPEKAPFLTPLEGSIKEITNDELERKEKILPWIYLLLKTDDSTEEGKEICRAIGKMIQPLSEKSWAWGDEENGNWQMWEEKDTALFCEKLKDPLKKYTFRYLKHEEGSCIQVYFRGNFQQDFSTAKEFQTFLESLSP